MEDDLRAAEGCLIGLCASAGLWLMLLVRAAGDHSLLRRATMTARQERRELRRQARAFRSQADTARGRVGLYCSQQRYEDAADMALLALKLDALAERRLDAAKQGR